MKTPLLIAVNLTRELFRKKDLYVLGILLLVLLAYVIQTAFFGVKDIFRYVKEIGLGIVFLFSIIIAVPFAARSLLEEIATKTIYPLLAKPVTRWQVILGKYLGCLFVSGSAFSLFFLLFAAADVYNQGLTGLALTLQVYGAGILMLLVLNAITLALSVYCTFSTTVTLSYLIYFLMTWFGGSLRDLLDTIPSAGLAIYYLLPHFEFFDLRHRLVHLWEPVPGWVMLFLAFYAVTYSLLALIAAFLGFRKRWL
ncbi:MAG: ABC transporter permease subunit [Candidatus Omnitrophica bacterium]|nr:ABC transporter permease subunit [Candidatus Omnitrophota bacterium]